MICNKCKIRGKTWQGSNPKCAFSEGNFGGNWNCATVNEIRDICYEGQKLLPIGVSYQYCDDQKYATIKIDSINISGNPIALWVSWYKSRGATDAMWLLFDDMPPRLPTEKDCLAIIKFYDNQCLNIDGAKDSATS